VTEKTEEATPKRQRKAREEGDSPISAFASQAVGFLAASFLLPAMLTALVARSTLDLRSAIARAGEHAPGAAFAPHDVAAAVLATALPILAAAGATAAVASVVQSGGAIATRRLAPRLSRLDVFQGLRQLVSVQRLVALLRAALLALGVAYLAHAALRAHAGDLARSAGRLGDATRVAGVVALEVVKRAALLGLLLAVVDVVTTRRSWRKRLMMSRSEVKREQKESDGDPQLKAARERAHHEVLAAATLGNVRHATVVVVNPTHIACALRYDEASGDDAPVVVASGHGDLAARIVEAARAHGVPVLRDVPLARALVELEVGTSIPEALYETVAEILREAWDDPDERP